MFWLFSILYLNQISHFHIIFWSKSLTQIIKEKGIFVIYMTKSCTMTVAKYKDIPI